MRPEDVLQLLRARPFQPFMFYMTDGTAYEIRHPELVIVERSKLIVGLPGTQGPAGPVESSVFCALIHITRIQPVNGKPL